MLNLNFVTPKRHFFAYEPSRVKISSVVFPVLDGKKKGKERYKKSRKRYISPIHVEAPREPIFTKFCILSDVPDVIICANFDMEKLTRLEYTGGGSNFGFSH